MIPTWWSIREKWNSTNKNIFWQKLILTPTTRASEWLVIQTTLHKRERQYDQMVELFVQYLAIHISENWPNRIEVGSKFSQTLNAPLQIWPRLLNYCQSGEISRNLVTLERDTNDDCNEWQKLWTNVATVSLISCLEISLLNVSKSI